VSNNKNKSWIKNPDVFSHLKDKEIVFLSNINSSFYLEGNEFFASFWLSFNKPFQADDFKDTLDSLSPAYFEFMLEHELIIPSNEVGELLSKIKITGLHLKQKPYPTGFTGEIYSYASGQGGSSDY